MIIPENEILIFRKQITHNDNQISDFEDTLSEEEKLKANNYRTKDLKNDYIFCRGFLRYIISTFTGSDSSGIVFSYNKNGKPFIEGSKIKFNLSHSKGFLVIALCLYDEIGIDVEYKREIPDLIDISGKYFSENEFCEMKTLTSSEQRDAFFRCWTRKEAFVKALGEGLQFPLSDFSVSFLKNEPPEVKWIRNNEAEISHWKIFEIPAGNEYISSLAVMSVSKKIVIIN